MATNKLRVGNVDLVGVSDASVAYPWPLQQIFAGVPEPTWEGHRVDYPRTFADANVWRSEYTCYLLRSAGRTILVDTGMGPLDTPLAATFGVDGQLLERLAAEGVTPEDIEIVVLGHLHPDHVGWNVLPSDAGFRLTFPRAHYVVHRADWEAFHRPEVQAHFPWPYVERTITPIEELGALQLIEGDEAVTPEIQLWHTPGHTPGHLSTLITSEGQRALIWGDVAMHPAQVSDPDLNAMFELDPDTARATRHRVLERVEAEGMLVAARHFPEPGFGHVVQLEGRRYWQSAQMPKP
jgi:glyoxylase-like metal-dependent hydrolase (beta-lactamase superfamily II)